MFLRAAAFACAAALFAASAPAMADPQTSSQQARCEATNFRVYFSPNSAALSADAMETLAVASRDVAGCGYRELHISVDAASRLGTQRGQAVMAALQDRGWNVARIEPRAVTPIAAGPDYAEVTVTPDRLPRASAAGDAGV